MLVGQDGAAHHFAERAGVPNRFYSVVGGEATFGTTLFIRGIAIDCLQGLDEEGAPSPLAAKPPLRKVGLRPFLADTVFGRRPLLFLAVVRNRVEGLGV